MYILSKLDMAALAYFFVAWISFHVFADHSRWREKNVTEAMHGYRYRWMTEMYKRELKMVDAQILGNLSNGIAFFASTAILIVGSLCAVLGATDTVVAVLEDLPIAVSTSKVVWELKVLLLICIFVYAFVKFAWSFRLSSYFAIMIGAAPYQPLSEEDAKREAHRPARMSNLVGVHFNRGLRAYFFALAALGWFIHPIAFVAATSWIVAMLYRREFRSRSLRVLTGDTKSIQTEFK